MLNPPFLKIEKEDFFIEVFLSKSPGSESRKRSTLFN